LKRDLILVAIALCTWGFGEGMFILFQPLYLEELGADPLMIGVIISGIGIAMTFSHIPAGYLADKIGRRPMLRAAWLLGTSAALTMAISNSLPTFIIGSTIYASTAFVISPLNSYITAARGKMGVGRVLTLISAAYNIGAIGGPIIGGWIGEQFGLRYNFLIAAIFFIISTAIIFNIAPQPVERQVTAKSGALNRHIFSKRYISYLLLVFFVMFSLYLPQPLSQNYVQNERNLDLSNIGYLISARSLGVVILNLMIGSLNSTLGIIISQLSVSLFTVFIYLGGSMPFYLIGYLLMGGYQTARSLTSAQARSLVDAPIMGISYGIVEAVNSTAIIVAPLLAGVLYTYNPDSIYWVGFILIIITILITIAFSPIKISLQKNAMD